MRLGQRIGAFLLERVLRREDVKRARQVVPLAGDRHVMFLHRLQKGGLGAGARPVDLVGHQELGEDRAADEAEHPLAVEPLLHHLGAENVGRHQVGRELHPQRVEPDDNPERLDELRLGEAGDADQEPVTARQQNGERQIDNPLLAEDDAADLGARRADPLERRVDVARQETGPCGVGHAHPFVLCAPMRLASGFALTPGALD